MAETKMSVVKPMTFLDLAYLAIQMPMFNVWLSGGTNWNWVQAWSPTFLVLGAITLAHLAKMSVSVSKVQK